jgi:hypothetical protein
VSGITVLGKPHGNDAQHDSDDSLIDSFLSLSGPVQHSASKDLIDKKSPINVSWVAYGS